MKKLTVMIIIILISVLTASSAFAAASVTLSTTTATPGSSITVTGTAAPDTGIAVKATDGDGNIVFFDAVHTDASGNYSVVFKVPGNAIGTLTITAGSDTDVASAGNGTQIGFYATIADFDEPVKGTAGFNVKPGDVIKVYVVDALSNDPGVNPVLLQ